MTGVLFALPVPVGARYVPVRGQYHIAPADCPWCGHRAPTGMHPRVECLACGVPQCNASDRCAACLHGWLPGWSRGLVWDSGQRVGDLCGYKRCGAPAVANAPQIRRVCAGHLARPKINGRPLVDAIAANVVTALDPAGRHGPDGWRKLVLRVPA